MQKEYYDKLTNAGFEIVKNLLKTEIPKVLLERYGNLPTEYMTFLKTFESVTNLSETTWFNLSKDFNGKPENEFKWNEFELLSIEWSEDDDEELLNISKFWNKHVPIVLSVKDGFQFLAICLEDEKYGEIVHGREPEFEDVTRICSNFSELIELLEGKEILNII